MKCLVLRRAAGKILAVTPPPEHAAEAILSYLIDFPCQGEWTIRCKRQQDGALRLTAVGLQGQTYAVALVAQSTNNFLVSEEDITELLKPLGAE